MIRTKCIEKCKKIVHLKKQKIRAEIKTIFLGKKMLTLIREIRTDKSILGSLYLNGAFVCYTLENARTAIPAGLYKVENSKSPKFKRELPLIYNKAVPATRGIRIHKGNTWEDSSGCVLVGMSHNADAGKPGVDSAIFESAPAETMVTMLCRNVTELIVTEEHG